MPHDGLRTTSTTPPLSGFSPGFGLVEILVALGLFLIMITGGSLILSQSLTTNQLGAEETYADQYAQEGIEAVRSIKNRNMASIVAGTYGLSNAGNQWNFSGSSDTRNGYTRQVVISEGRRTGNQLVNSGGTVDPDLFKVTVNVTWNFRPTRANTVTQTSYLTNFRKNITPPGNWALPSANGSYDASGNTDGRRIATSGNYAYMIRSSGAPDFFVINITNPAAPTLAGSTSVGNAATNIFVAGSFAYVTGTSNTQELRIVNISNPAAPTVVGTYNAPGNADMNDVFVIGSTAYAVRSNSTDPEFVVLNVTNPAAVSLTGSLNLNGNSLEVGVSGTYAAISSGDDNQELQLVNITTPATPSLSGTYNATGTTDGVAVAFFDTTVVLSQSGGSVYLISTSTPSTPTLVSTYAAGGTVNDISLGFSNTYAFLATANAASEFQVLNITNPASPTLLGSSNLAGTAFGVAYNATLNRAAVTTNINTTEYLTMQPN
jgi:Tfp pilus assembly protein PilV